MLKLWWIQLFWLALALPGFALLRRWDRDSLQRGFLFALGRSYLASLVLLTPISVLGYWQHWPLWTLSAAYVAAVLCGGASLGHAFVKGARARAATHVRAASAEQANGAARAEGIARRSGTEIASAPTGSARTARSMLAQADVLAAVGCVVLCLDLWLGARAGTHLLGDAGYHIARVRMLIAEGFSNWDPIVAEQRVDIIYHANIYHALIAVSAQLSGSDAALAWIATFPFAKLLAAGAVFQLGCSAFGSTSYGWLATLSLIAAQCSYSALPLPNTLAPLALLPMGLCAGMQLFAARPPPLAAAWLAASAVVLAQVHALNAMFLALVVAPVLLLVLLTRVLFRRGAKRTLIFGFVACAASLPWMLVAGGPRIQLMLQDALPFLKASEPARDASPRPEHAASPEPDATTPDAITPRKPQYKAERFRKLPNGWSAYEPSQLRGAHDAYSIALAIAVVTLALVRRRELWALAAFVACTCAWLIVPILCTLLLRFTNAPWATLRINQFLPLAFFTFVPGGPLSWLTRCAWPRLTRARALLQLGAAGIALFAGLSQNGHGEPWTLERLWEHAREHEAQLQWQHVKARQQLLCEHIPARETVMAHPRWDYVLPMHCRIFAVALSPGRGWHGLAFMDERRADVDQFFQEGTSAQRRLELMRKYELHYVYTNPRFARRIVNNLPRESHVLAQAREGTVLRIDY